MTASQGPPFLTPDGQPRAFVIVSSARSGSNLLVGYLRQVRQVACFGEILRSDFPDRPGWDKLVERLDLPAEARTLHAQDLTAFWQLVLAHGLRRRRWLGAKAFYYHRRDDPVWERFAAADHRVIHLWRDATFDQYVSRLLAMDTGEWKAPDTGGAPDSSRGGGSRGGAPGDLARGGGAGAPAAETEASTADSEISAERGAGADAPAAETEASTADSEISAERGAGADAAVTFDQADYLRYREALLADVRATRARYGSSGRYVELEYRQLLDHSFVETQLERLFGERIDVAETLHRQRGRPKIEYLSNPADGAPFTADSIERGFAAP